MTKTTEQWEALLDGTTPGPWKWHGGQDPDMRYIYADEGGMCMTVEPVGSDYRDADPVLAAHAPEAVAEVVRLRREIEALRKAWDASATLYVKRALAHPTSERYDILSETHTRIAYTLTRILEGGNDE